MKKNKLKTKDLCLIAMFTALITVGAFIKIPTPLCPITFQTLFVMLAGVLLGGKKGAAACAVYVFAGLAGLPLFTGGGGITYVLKPTFGYLIGFIAGAFVTGAIVYGGTLTFKRTLIGCFAGLLIVYAFGVPYLWAASRFWLEKPIGIWAAILSGFLTPLPSDIPSCIIASVIGCRLIPAVNRQNYTSPTKA